MRNVCQRVGIIDIILDLGSERENYLLEKKKYCYWPSVKMLIIKTK